ncbi:dihydroxyacetone kinase subunit DhaL [Amycolatopsis jejuensis]|uniref:dihydroxyacetone kinase subunit DhaL n=1 Tax=Amycolatopsis jejuensis TaxID=330084 RepID=UPI00052713DF|nr:dihydroxyacetone kinase subunit DhaL [Amycolatopsis jejuensis]
MTAQHWIEAFAASVREHAAGLADADRLAGDGDYGDNLTSAVQRAEKALQATKPDTPGGVLLAVSDGFLATGGTSGPLFGMWFRELGRSVGAELTTAGLAEGAARGAATVQRLGKAEVGHKTMVDAMVPAASALAAGGPLDEALDRAAAAALQGAESTKDLVARRGRASYVGEHAVGVVDPGARTVALFFAAGAQVTSA